MHTSFQISLASRKDLPFINDLMTLAINKLQKPFLTSRQISASFEVMGLDQQLITDGTYLAVRAENVLVGCGG